MVNIGEKVADFSVPATGDKSLSLSDFRDKNLVIYFYPKDDTPGCTMEGLEFTELMSDFDDLGVAVIGVSKDSCASHRAFRDKYGLGVQLLSDTTGELCERYGVWQEKEKNGVKKMGIVRSTFLIDKQGMLAEAQYGVTADGHAEDMLERLRRL